MVSWRGGEIRNFTDLMVARSGKTVEVSEDVPNFETTLDEAHNFWEGKWDRINPERLKKMVMTVLSGGRKKLIIKEHKDEDALEEWVRQSFNSKK